MYFRSRTQQGLSLLEVLVVVSIIGILSSVVYASFSDSRAQTRDAQRKTDLKQLQLAIEQYRSQNGVYPAGCSGTAWGGPGPQTGGRQSCNDWIVGLVPESLDELPRDPNQEDEENRGFQYRTNGSQSAYKVMLRNTVERIQVSGYDDEFARCPRDCTGETGASPACDDTPPTNVYAVYSEGGQCW